MGQACSVGLYTMHETSAGTTASESVHGPLTMSMTIIHPNQKSANRPVMTLNISIFASFVTGLQWPLEYDESVTVSIDGPRFSIASASEGTD